MARFDQYKEPPRALEGLKVVELPCLDTMPFMAASMAAKSFADFGAEVVKVEPQRTGSQDRKSTRLNSSHQIISYAVFCLKKKKVRRTYRQCIESARVAS